MGKPHILIIDDEPLMRISIADALKAEGHQVKVAATGPEGVDFIKKEQFDIIISDLRLPGLDGLQVLQTCREVSPRTGVVVITAHGSVETAVEAMKIGAYDYITKPFSMDELLLIVKRLVKMLELEDENRSLREELEGRFSFKGILSKNQQMRDVLEKIKLVAPSDSTILIVGESGTGKEVVANAIHHNSPRREGPFIRVSCAALPESLETELFGHEKGAFTGALRQRKGRFELANHGTLFLDEIGEISPAVQVKLMRVLQDRQFERVGGTATVEVEVRLVCATRRDLKKEAQAGRFREDLYHRLSIAPLYLLPLRERKEDVLLLAEHFLEKLGNRIGKRRRSLSEPAKGMVLRYSFPGNVRELENTIERAVSLSNHEGSVEPWDLCGFPSCPYLGGLPQPACGFCREDTHLMAAEYGARVGDLSAAREQFERQHILKVLDRTRDNKTEAARILGVSRKALWEKCKRYGISKGTNGVEED